MSLKEQEEQLAKVDAWVDELNGVRINDNHVRRILRDLLIMIRDHMVEEIAVERGG